MKHQEVIGNMTLEEKAAFLSGKTVWETRDYPRLGIPSIFCSDGPHGIRRQAGEGDHLGLNPSLPATCFPTAATIANSWDEELGEEIGKALGEEAAAQGVDVILGPGLNIKRSPLCGRNFEYFSEDPYLSGKMTAAYIRGMQSQGVSGCPKHFAVNSQELRRMSMNAVVDERTLRELYLTGFEIAVKEGNPGAIMTSYNEINGTYANENQHLLQDILREEWGFEGMVVTDWGGSNDHVKGVALGSNLEMPTPGLDSARQLIKAVEDGSLSMEKLDQCVDTLLDTVLTLTAKRGERPKDFDKKEHHELARRAAGEGTVLLKNEGDLLPLSPGAKVAIVGDFAFEPRYQGAGSSVVNPLNLESTAQTIADYDLQIMGICKGYIRTGEESLELQEEALRMAASADVVLYYFGLNELSETEGIDRTHLGIPKNQVALLKELFKVNKNLVGVISAGAVIEMPWEKYCTAILHGYLGGQAGSRGILDILTGAVNPSGKLAETYPMKYEDTPARSYFPSKGRDAQYREGLYVGYRYYDMANGSHGLNSPLAVRYPFGYGLSYTTFAYEDLQIEEHGVSFILRNTGRVKGAETAQLYVGLPAAKVFRPKKELKGFCKVVLEPGESKRVTIDFDQWTFRYWNVKTDRWEIEEGLYDIMIGASSAHICLKGSIPVKGTTGECPYEKEDMPSYYTGEIQKVGDGEFEKLLGRPVPQEKQDRELTVNDPVCQMKGAKSLLARLIYKILTGLIKRSEKKGKPDLNLLFIYNIPFRGIAKMTNGMVSMEMAEGMVQVVNGHFFRGMKKIIGGFFRNRKENSDYEKKLERRI